MDIPRSQAIARIRKYLKAYAKGRKVTCQVAAEERIFCKGFDQYQDGELQALYDWLYRPGMTREALVKLAIQYETGRMTALEADITCDTHEYDRDFCKGFPHFSNVDLKRLAPRLFGADETIVDDDPGKPVDPGPERRRA